MRVVIAGVAAWLLVACAGAVGPEQVDAERRERGGGLSQRQILDAVEALERVHDGAVRLRSVTVSATGLALEARFFDESDDLGICTFGYRDGRLFGPTPATRPSTVSPAAPLFSVEQAGVARFDGMVEDAIAEADLAGGFAAGAEIRSTSYGPLVEVAVTDGTDGTGEVRVTFAADGTLVEVER